VAGRPNPRNREKPLGEKMNSNEPNYFKMRVWDKAENTWVIVPGPIWEDGEFFGPYKKDVAKNRLRILSWAYQLGQNYIGQVGSASERKIVKDAVDRFGIDDQMCMLQEECAELIVATNKVKRRKGDAIPNFFEEIADVEIIISQMREYWGNEKIDLWKNEKIRRLGELLK
jgi:hypothetical protein